MKLLLRLTLPWCLQIKASQPTVAGSIKEPPLNLVEAVDKLNPSIATNTGLQKVTPLLERSKATPLNAESNSFWIMVRVLEGLLSCSRGRSECVLLATPHRLTLSVNLWTRTASFRCTVLSQTCTRIRTCEYSPRP